MTGRFRVVAWPVRGLAGLILLLLLAGPRPALSADGLTVQEYPVAERSTPHDAVPDRSGQVWYTGQANGTVGRLDPATGETTVVSLGPGSAPHGVIIGPDDGVWVTDGGLNAIVRVDPATLAVQVYPLPGPRANLNTATFDHRGILWFTGQSGYLGRLDPATGVVQQFDAPRGPGPYGISTAPDGTVYFASLAGSYLGRIDGDDGAVTVIEPPTPSQGARRVWPDSAGRLWISEYNAGQLARYDPASGQWAEWRLPGAAPRPYAVYVDQQDKVWLSDTARDVDDLVRFDPATETFTSVEIGRPSIVAQLGGIPGEVWGAERARDHLVVVRYQ